MGFFDDLRQLVKGKDKTEVEIEDPYAKSMLIRQILSSVDKINKINSFDRSIATLKNVSSNQLQLKSMAELQQISDNLSYQISSLNRQEQRAVSGRESFEEAKWTGKRPNGMTNHEFDRAQKDEGR